MNSLNSKSPRLRTIQKLKYQVNFILSIWIVYQPKVKMSALSQIISMANFFLVEIFLDAIRLPTHKIAQRPPSWPPDDADLFSACDIIQSLLTLPRRWERL